ncbi:MAG: 1-deoxy-D-xylulose-5-phosphate reductoisomerase [Prevotellaceae bacterium]|nr:1-deoxy-D-xylulose-5-phosphate reductoisomerase [Prevotellaceae bacterium]MDY3855578.1 1-deoxy-D-xylulose-5-phosphate reductoisomerase [Bacteroidaceae bacterium]
MKKKIAILGSTGSIGTQTLDVIAEHSDLYEARVLTAGSNASKLIAQARQFAPDAVVIANEAKYAEVRDALADTDVKVYAGAKALREVVTMPSVDVVVSALVGFAGLEPTLAAIMACKTIALANKETLVVGGQLVQSLAAQYKVAILPVDSEHSAIFQCLAGEGNNEIDKIILTASGGPFRKFTREQLDHVTAADALHHPTWVMGDKITIDSATMMNKGFEVIEAKWLFGVDASKIEVHVHPQSIVHSAVQFSDGSVKAQLGIPDMRLPIQYALSYPSRLPLSGKRLNLFEVGQLTFEKPDTDRFPCLSLAYEATQRGGNIPCALNAANEVANLAFRQGRLSYNGIYQVIRQVIDETDFDANADLDVYRDTDRQARLDAQALIKP